MQKLKLTRFKEGCLYSLIFIGFNIIKNLIFNHEETINLLHKLIQDKATALPIVFITFLSLWLFLSLLIGSGLTFYDFVKKRKENHEY